MLTMAADTSRSLAHADASMHAGEEFLELLSWTQLHPSTDETCLVVVVRTDIKSMVYVDGMPCFIGAWESIHDVVQDRYLRSLSPGIDIKDIALDGSNPFENLDLDPFENLDLEHDMPWDHPFQISYDESECAICGFYHK
jgi:hypothetical protein